MRLQSKVDPAQAKTRTHVVAVPIRCSESSMHLMALQKHELIALIMKGIASDRMGGILSLLDVIQDTVDHAKIIGEDYIFPCVGESDDREEKLYPVDIPIAERMQDVLQRLRIIECLEDCVLHINDKDEVLAKYARYCLRQGHVDTCGYLQEWLQEIE